MNWSFIIFCYNEGDNLNATVHQCVSFLKQNATQYEIIVVNDGSSDHTPEVCNQLAATIPHLKVVHHPGNMGIGKALRTGYALAKLDYVCAIPGDGQFNTAELLNVKNFGNDVFYSFYRVRNNYTIYRRTLTVLNRLFNIMFLNMNMKDINWIKVYRREQLIIADPQLKSSIVESEICAKLIRNGCTPIEVPSVYHMRTSGEAKGGAWKTVKMAIRETWTLYQEVNRYNKCNAKPLHAKAKKLEAEA